MIDNSFRRIISFSFSFFQIIIYITEFLISKEENIEYCPSKTDIGSTKILNNIINIGRKNFRYVNFASYSNGDMVFLTTSYLGNSTEQNTKIFYGFEQNGRPLINESYFYSFQLNESIIDREKHEGESLVIKQSGNNTDKKEFLLTLSKKFSFVEIYDFEKEIIYKKDLNIFANCTYNITSFRHAFIPLSSNDTNYYYLFGFINHQNIYIIQKHIFNSIQDFETEDTLIKNITIKNFNAKAPTSGLSCFQTEKQFIICFFLTSKSNFSIIAYDTNLEKMNNFNISSKIICSKNPFYKCLHLKEEIGIFSYYNNSFPVLFLLKYNNNSGFNYIIPEIILNETENNETKFLDDILLNDIIKITEKKIYYCCTETNKKKFFLFQYIYIIIHIK